METINNILCCGENPTIDLTFHNEQEGYGILCSEKCGNLADRQFEDGDVIEQEVVE